MLDWLLDERKIVYGALLALAVLFLFQWWTTRKRGWVYGIVGVGLLAALHFLLDTVIETRAEEIERKVHEMARGVEQGDAEAIFRHVSDDFMLKGMDKDTFKGRVAGILKNRWVSEVECWDFEIPEDKPDPGAPPEKESIRIFCRVKPKGRFATQSPFFLCRLRFVRDPDGEWRLQWFEVSDPVGDQALEIPYLR